MIPIRDSIVTRHTPFVVYAIIIVNVAVFLYQLSLPIYANHQFLMEYGLVPLRYTNPVWAQYQGLSPRNYLPFVSNFFMHGGWLHIILNMWTLYIFGSSMEGRFGSVAFFIFYMLAGIVANLAHVYFNQTSPLPVLGASGAIAGVIGAYAVTFPRARITLVVPIVFIPLFFKLPALSFAVIWFGLQILQGAAEIFKPSMGGDIAWWAHIGGFVAGVLLLPLLHLGGLGREQDAIDERESESDRDNQEKKVEEIEKTQEPPWTPGPWG